jgi:hypothetical protein
MTKPLTTRETLRRLLDAATANDASTSTRAADNYSSAMDAARDALALPEADAEPDRVRDALVEACELALPVVTAYKDTMPAETRDVIAATVRAALATAKQQK